MNRFEDRKPSTSLGRAAGLAVAVIGLLAACAPSTPAADPAATESPEVLARIGDLEITRAEVEDAVASELKALDRQRHELLEQGLDQIISDRLLEIAAEARGMTRESFVAAEVEAGLAAVTEADIDRFYEQRKDQIPQPKAAVSAQIRQYLEQTQRQEAMAGLMSRLREEHEPVIELDPLRVEVATAGAPAKGPESAPVTIVEFSDFECPFCSRIIPTLERVTREYPDSVRLVFRQFPLASIHPNAQKAAEASLCANDQGRFWDMHDAMFEDQRALSIAGLEATAARLGLDAAAFGECLAGGRHAERVASDLRDGVEAGVSGTPALFVNGRFLSGAQPYEAIAKVIDDELRRAEG